MSETAIRLSELPEAGDPGESLAVLLCSLDDRRGWRVEPAADGRGAYATARDSGLQLMLTLALGKASEDWVLSVDFVPIPPPRWKIRLLTAALLAASIGAGLATYALTGSAIAAVAVAFATLGLSLVATLRFAQARHRDTSDPKVVTDLVQELRRAVERPAAGST
jgi:hypothetical protein